jgi:hypothetical protein
LRKSLKEFHLNLKRKVVLKRSLKKRKEKRETLPSHLSAQTTQQPAILLPARAHVLSLFFFFFALADAWAPLVGLSLSPFLSSSPLPRRPAAAAANLATPRPASFPSFPSSSSLPIKAINHSRSSGAVSLSFAPSRDGRGHQWQVPPLGAPSPSLALLPVLLFKPVLKRLRLPLPFQRTHSLA